MMNGWMGEYIDQWTDDSWMTYSGWMERGMSKQVMKECMSK